MSRSDHGTRLTTPSHSRPPSRGHLLNQDLLTESNSKSTRMAALNVLFLGETDIGESSIIDLIAGREEQKRTPPHPGRRALGNDVRSVTLDGKIFTLHASSTSGSMSSAALRGGIQNTLANLRRNGGIHLLAYCVNALHSTLWIYEIHRIIASCSTLSPRIPMVAIIAGMSDVAQQESWWSSNEVALTDQGPHFDDHAFIRVTTAVTQLPTGDHFSESRQVLHALILQNYAINSGLDSDCPRVTPYRQRFTGSSIQSLLVMLAGKPSSHPSASSKAIDVVLLGEIGVGKSSLINLIARQEVAGVSPDTIGCTRIATEYIFEEQDTTFHLYDTPGLVDPQMGVKPFVDPIDTIHKLIRSLGNGNGPDLLLFCIDHSKPTAALQRNYRLFCKIICGGKVPFALAITKLEEGQSADQWWSQYGATIGKYGIDCSGRVWFGREKRHSDPSADMEGQARVSLLSFFIACTGRQKNRVGSLRRMIGSVSSLLGSRASTEKTLMNQCGLEEETARELVNRMIFLTQSDSDKLYA